MQRDEPFFRMCDDALRRGSRASALDVDPAAGCSALAARIAAAMSPAAAAEAVLDACVTGAVNGAADAACMHMLHAATLRFGPLSRVDTHLQLALVYLLAARESAADACVNMLRAAIDTDVDARSAASTAFLLSLLLSRPPHVLCPLFPTVVVVARARWLPLPHGAGAKVVAAFCRRVAGTAPHDAYMLPAVELLGECARVAADTGATGAWSAAVVAAARLADRHRRQQGTPRSLAPCVRVRAAAPQLAGALWATRDLAAAAARAGDIVTTLAYMRATVFTGGTPDARVLADALQVFPDDPEVRRAVAATVVHCMSTAAVIAAAGRLLPRLERAFEGDWPPPASEPGVLGDGIARLRAAAVGT